MVKTMEECLQILGCKKPFKKYNLSKNPFDDMLTDKGYKAYNKLREILFFMVDMDIIPEFNEDKLDKFIDINE